MKPLHMQSVLLLAVILGLSGCVSTSRYTLRASPAPINRISIETKRQKTFPATKWLSESSGWSRKYTDDQFVGRILALPFYPVTFLIDTISFAHKTTYTTEYDFEGTILLDGKPYSNKTFSLSGPITSNLQTDSTGRFKKTFPEPGKAYRKPISDTTLQFEFAQAADFTSGATVSMVVPLAIELTLNNEGKELRIESRNDLVPYLSQGKDITTRDAIATEWKRTDANARVNLTTQNFYSAKNRQITASEELEAAKRRQEEDARAELERQEAQRLREKKEAEQAKKCAKQKAIIKDRHLCSAILPQFMAGQATPELDCIYLNKSEMYNPFIKVLSIANDGCVYYFDNSHDMMLNPEPIFVYAAGNPDADSESLRRVYPALQWMYITATCGNVDLPLPIGYYAYNGQYSYAALRGNTKKVYSFKKLDIDPSCLE